MFQSKKNNMRFWWWLKKLIYLWVKSKAVPKGTSHCLQLPANKPVCYVLKKKSFLDLLVLDYHCRKEKLPRPLFKLKHLSTKTSGAYLYLNHTGFFKDPSPNKQTSKLQSLLRSSSDTDKHDVQVIPVSVFWGRDPGKVTQSFLKLLFFDDEHGGRLNKLITFILHGRHVFCNFGQAISTHEFIRNEKKLEPASKKLRRILRIHFRRQRVAFLGPYIYDRNRTIHSLLRASNIKQAIEQARTRKKLSLLDAKKLAFKYINEIAANTTYSTLRALEIAMLWLFKKMYTDIQVTNDEKIRQLAQEYEIVYLPCHRSHMDYLIIGFSIYQLGLTPPHTAAGINLNFWPVGYFLRKGGAFFIRRSFVNNRLYKSVFNEYLSFLLSEGFSLKFYIEGQRSRTGKLLKPKGGMLSMIVNQAKAKPTKKTLLVPIYIGYDKLIEEETYLKELSGKKKQTESFSQLLKARKLLQKPAGKAYLNFGEPIYLQDHIRQHQAHVAKENPDAQSLETLNKAFVNQLSFNIMSRINEAAVVTPIGLFSLALLATPTKALNEKDLLTLSKKWCDLLKIKAYAKSVRLPTKPLQDELHQVEQNSPIARFSHPGGDVIYVDEKNSAILTYYKNNMTHLFAIPSLIASLFEHNEQMPYDNVLDTCQSLYHVIRDDFFLPWEEDASQEIFKDYLDALIKLDFLTKDPNTSLVKRVDMIQAEYAYTKILGKIIGSDLEKYALFTGLLYKHKHQQTRLTQDDFETECKLITTRLNILEGSRDSLFDKKRFDEFILLLKTKAYIKLEDNTIIIDATLDKLATHALILLSMDVRQSLLELNINKQT